MPITPHNLVRHELIGLKVKINKSTDSTQKGLVGTVIDETYNTLKIETKDGKERTAIKENSVFLFILPNKTKIQIDGKLLVSRPEDRIKKKLPKW
ncbi:MAG: ribonuclease P protein component 1 [Candidatus Aenigmarchaeota archaeon]|nr:ribonuclease P protein component 1 [Candidatus Aenigmarchaeota archaeon]